MASQMKFIVALAIAVTLVAAVVNAQDYDDEGGNQGNDGYGGFSGSGGGDDDYAAPRERGIVGAEGSDLNPYSHSQGGDDGAGNENYDSDDSAAAASNRIVKLIKRGKF